MAADQGEKPRYLSALDPGKQGLKPGFTLEETAGLVLSALDPGKQGLKRRHGCCATVHGKLSALDPGKQGLKHGVDLTTPEGLTTFSA